MARTNYELATGRESSSRYCVSSISAGEEEGKENGRAVEQVNRRGKWLDGETVRREKSKIKEQNAK